ncbi:DUF262 domain-containing protein [Xenophilus arseniciresistens]|uniref:DUF262 domain-containing protein n=1 Tax=Xenophilus arseniciresistens TaxID=1283306 RepID=A0AAE3T172_9BURK|nr:DUF262 domain-containing protein [Xenophilus arseniciresistens]MDA7417067.1 DUF262 domain-containing protein [Xenophilus arseniciresistens]
MKVEQEIWTVSDFVSEKEKIQISPAWQRGPAWTAPRQVLLIDSMLRSLDIPKVYLRVRDQNGAYAYDAVDGQQRLRAIWLFRDNELPLKNAEKLEPIGQEDVNGKTYSALPKRLRDAFDEFEITVAKIVESDQLEISRLFSRLQQGVPLNPAELRNAMLGPVRNLVEAIALSHSFFTNSRIPQPRYRRQDYVAHVFALGAHGTELDIKAPNLKHLYQEFDASHNNALMKISKEVEAAFAFLDALNALLGFSIRHKWIVVDLAWWVIQQLRLKVKLDVQVTASRFQVFDALRRKFTHAPEEALVSSEVSKRLSKHLYNYLVAFKLQGGTKGNVLVRSNAIDQFLSA